MISRLVLGTYKSKLYDEVINKFPQSKNFGIPVLCTFLIFGVKGNFNQSLVIFVKQGVLLYGLQTQPVRSGTD